MSDTDTACFLDLLLAGKESPVRIDDYVDRWHASGSGASLHDWLGMTWEEYASWAENPANLAVIVAARRRRAA